MKKQAGLLLLGALLVGCGPSGGGEQPPGTSGYTISGNVLPPGSAAASLTSQELDALWRAPHVTGQVLVQGGEAGTLGTQALSVLSGVRLQAVPETDLQLALTPAGQDDLGFARRLAAAGLSVQPNFLYRALAVPNDPGFPGENRPGVQVGGSSTIRTTSPASTRWGAGTGWRR